MSVKSRAAYEGWDKRQSLGSWDRSRKSSAQNWPSMIRQEHLTPLRYPTSQRTRGLKSFRFVLLFLDVTDHETWRAPKMGSLESGKAVVIEGPYLEQRKYYVQSRASKVGIYN
jgi:hypothetical protein